MEDKILTERQIDTKNITRFEVINQDEGGRVYVKYDVDVEILIQDDGRTMKVFVKPKIPTHNT